MTLTRVWNPNFAACATTPDTQNEQTLPAPLSTIIAQDTGTHDVFKKYVPVKCHPSGTCSVGWANGHKRIWRDRNHAQRALLYNCFVFPVNPASIYSTTIPSPARDVGLGVTLNSLHLAGAELRFDVSSNNLELPKNATIQVLVQVQDNKACDGRGTSVNYVLADNPTVDRVLGFSPPTERTGAQTVAGQTAWKPYVAKCGGHIIPLAGRADKMAQEVYGVSAVPDHIWEGKLLNFQLVIMVGYKQATFSGETVTSIPTNADVPALEPLLKADGGYGQIYLRNVELWVDPMLNPNAVAV